MVNNCGVHGCFNRSNRDRKSFYCLPAVPAQRYNQRRRDLYRKRRETWLERMGREDLLSAECTKNLKLIRVCSDHFISGATVPGMFHAAGSSTSNAASPSYSLTTQALVPLSERVVAQEATLLGFMAEKSLPFTMASDLIEFAKVMSKDLNALNSLSMSDTSASYKLRYGLAKTFSESLVQKLQRCRFSLNIDETTSENFHKVLTVLVSYYDDEKKVVVVDHLESVSISKCSSATVYEALQALFAKHDLPWASVMSIMMDSRNVMRGIKSGVETRVREELAVHLLDVNGDTCHHAHNAAKAFTAPFNRTCERFITGVFNDMQWSPDIAEMMGKVSQAMGISFTKPPQYVPTRWLSVYEATLDTLRLLDAYTVIYHGLLSVTDRAHYLPVLYEVFKRREVSLESKDQFREIQSEMRQKYSASTPAGKARKDKIVKTLFMKRRRLRLELHFFESVLPLLQQYVKFFESSEPLIHLLHDKQCELLKEFMGCFIRPELLSNASGKELVEVKVDDPENYLSEQNIFYGSKVQGILKSFPNDLSVQKFQQRAKSAYISCAQVLQNNMPVNNRLFRCLSAMDPACRNTATGLSSMLKLPELVSNVLADSEINSYNREVRKYHIDPALAVPVQNQRIDSWWSSVFDSGNYPHLSKLIKSVLSLFHGPRVESSFSVMSNAMDKGSSGMTVHTYSAIQSVKYPIAASGEGALKLFKKEDFLHRRPDPMLVKNMTGSLQSYDEESGLAREEVESMNVVNNTEAISTLGIPTYLPERIQNGKPSALCDEGDPDWAPSQNLRHNSSRVKTRSSERDRSRKRVRSVRALEPVELRVPDHASTQGRSSLDSSSPDYVPSVFSFIETNNSRARRKMAGSTLLPTVHRPPSVMTVGDEVGLVSPPPPPHRVTATGTVMVARGSALSEEIQDHDGDQSESLDPLTLEPSRSNEAHPHRLPESDQADWKDFTRLDWAPSLNMTTECNESSVKQSEGNLEGHQRMPLSAAEKQRRYRQRRDADPEKREKHLEKERERSRKDKDAGRRLSVSELNEREKVAKREYWREAQAKSRRAKAQLAATLEQCMTPPLSPEPAPGPSRLNMEMESSAPTSDQTLQPITQSDGKDASVVRGAHDLREAEAPEPQTSSTVDVKRRTVSSGIQCPYCRYRCGAKFSFQIHVGSQHPLRCEDVCVGRLGKVVFYQCTAKLFHCHICFFTSKDYAVLFEHLLARHCLTTPKAARAEKGEGPEQDRTPNPELKPDQDDMTEERSNDDSLKRKRSSASSGEDEDEDVKVSDSVPAAAVERDSDSSSAPYYECKLCKERYKNKGSLLHHVSREHNALKPHACKECSESFMLESLLTRHVSLYHRQEVYQCPYCPFESSLAGLHQHLSQCRAVEGSEDKGGVGTEQKE